ncbi:flagellar hook-basal body complex protein [uncultured Clostridium sp.]|uniref:flagellar hook-basal body complex protein n=1 Tax=uncultured Clostridium sp. TaxID=59620 RepID=UPI0008230FE1|nr:flagellar hook-basal body complex protein [uncultured Clostridium sp.]SCJ66937.1 Distal rod protein [uncultured Clostridium sp.]
MYGILNVSKSGMSSTQNKINVISNNIVNSNTAGYKKLDVEFQDLVRAGLSNNSYPTNDVNATTGTGIKSTTEVRNFTQGSLKNTKISTNLAIDGEGLFRVIRSDNTYAYTRNGEFSVDANGTLVDDAGNILDIQFEDEKNYNNSGITSDNLSVNKQGEVFVNDEKIGNINLYKPTGDNDVLSASGNLFIANDGVELIAADGDIYQGYTEMSNVDIYQEFTDLIAMQRAFQLNSKGFTVADEMWSMINNLQSR